MMTSEIDRKIRPLVDLLNSLPGVRTTGSCQGHIRNGHLLEPSVSFVCTDERVLGMLTSILEGHWPTLGGRGDSSWFWEHAPALKVPWEVLALPGDDPFIQPETDVRYVFYCLHPQRGTYRRPSETWNDIVKIVHSLRLLWAAVGANGTTANGVVPRGASRRGGAHG
jgi:hypothetical protein